MIVARNTKLLGTAHYNNTTSNPYNPNNPPLAVSLGEGTNDEMFQVYFWYTTYRFSDEKLVFDTTTPKMVLMSKIAVQNNTLSIYPNPNTGEKVYINCKEFTIQEVQIFDIQGRLIKIAPVTNNVFDISDVQKGIYSLLFKSHSENYIKQKLVLH